MRVSIIITYIDEIDYLKDAIQSALNQDITEKEIIVVCNKESSSFPVELDFYKERIAWIVEPVKGSAYARNAGLSQAKGEWIQFLDVDDLLLPGKIIHQLNNTTGDVIVSPHVFQFLNAKREQSKWIPDDTWIGLLNSGLGSTSSMLWRRKAVSSSNGWSKEYSSHQEYELLFRMAAAGNKIVPSTKYETIVRARTTGSITQSSKNVRAKEGIKLREEMWSYLGKNAMQTSERKKAFLSYIFKQLRGVYRIDQPEAIRLYTQYFKNESFKPADITLPMYKELYQLLGFRNTEKLFWTYSKLRDRFLPFFPKNR